MVSALSAHISLAPLECMCIYVCVSPILIIKPPSAHPCVLTYGREPGALCCTDLSRLADVLLLDIPSSYISPEAGNIMFALTDFAQAKLRSACAIKQMEA